MNAHAPTIAAILGPVSSPLGTAAHQAYAEILPRAAGLTDLPSPLAYPGEADDIIARRALRFALHLTCVAAQRACHPKSGNRATYEAQVATLMQALLDGDEWSTRFARSGAEDDLMMVEAAAYGLRSAAENIAYKEWGGKKWGA